MAKPDSINRIKRSDLKLKTDKPLGEGGFGSVYHMTWKKGFLSSSIDVAAKEVTKREVGEHELQMLSGLDHPNIVKLIGVVDEGIDFMLILELCKGGSLRSYLDKGQRITQRQFCAWLMQTALPLEFLKQKHIIHKDVKSPNYLITSDNTLKLGDFGLAKKLESTVSNATEGGSHPWMAPELLKDGKLSPKYDIFAFGVVAWELWTGKFPHKGLEWQVIVMKVCNRDERLPIPDDCPEPVKELIERCWKSDWKERPSIEEVISTIADDVIPQPVVTGPWKLEKEFGRDGAGKLGDAIGIEVNPNNGALGNGDIAITDWQDQNVKVYSDSGEFKFNISSRLNRPWQVAVNSNHDYLVTDLTSEVKVNDISGKFKGQWTSSPPRESSQSSSLRGLALNSEGHVLVGDVENCTINKHGHDGTYIGSINIHSQPWFMAVTSQDNIVVAGYCSTAPEIVSNTGQVIHSLKHPTHAMEPRGVCCQQGMIFITDYASKSIVCFSESCTCLGDIPIQLDGFPRGIAMTADCSKLLVIDNDFYGNKSVKVFSL